VLEAPLVIRAVVPEEPAVAEVLVTEIPLEPIDDTLPLVADEWA
jgi:hypothetical protein